MKKIITLVATLYIFSLASLKAQVGQTINIGTIDTVDSKILGEKRTVWVYVPKQDSSFAKAKYPVLYILDGDLIFSSATGMIQYLSSEELLFCPKMIVVGIIHKKRWKDLTPPNPYADSITKRKYGGGENLLAYIEKELMPYINKTYPTEPYNIFAGHSLGGLMVMQAFLYHHNIFNAYFSLDASMYWDKQRLLKQTDSLIAKVDKDDRPLYLAIANTMPAKFDTSSVKKDTTEETEHIRCLLTLNQLLKQKKSKFSSIYYSNYEHQPSLLTGTYDGLLWLFKKYQLTGLGIEDLSRPSIDTLKRKLDEHYLNFYKEFGFLKYPEEKVINRIAGISIQNKWMPSAEYLLKLNTVNYPTSFNALNQLGNFYEKQNDKAKAIEYFKRALLIKYVEETENKVNQLESK